MDCLLKIEQIRDGFVKCRKLLIAIGDETRQTIITVLMGSCSGLLSIIYLNLRKRWMQDCLRDVKNET